MAEEDPWVQLMQLSASSTFAFWKVCVFVPVSYALIVLL